MLLIQYYWIVISYIFGIGFCIIISYFMFNTIIPYYRLEIINEKKWVSSLEKMFNIAKREIIFTTLGFSTYDLQKRVKNVLNKTLRKGINIDIIASKERMPKNRYNILKKNGCEITLIPEEILDQNNRYWHHLMVVDSKHWLWISPHEPEKTDVHFGHFRLYDMDIARKKREKLMELKSYTDLI